MFRCRRSHTLTSLSSQFERRAILNLQSCLNRKTLLSVSVSKRLPAALFYWLTLIISFSCNYYSYPCVLNSREAIIFLMKTLVVGKHFEICESIGFRIFCFLFGLRQWLSDKNKRVRLKTD